MCLLQLFHTRARPEAYQYNNWSAPLCCWKYLSPTYQTKHLQWKATFPGFLLEFFYWKHVYSQTHTQISLNVCARMLAYILTQVVFRGSGGFLLACFQRLMWPGVLLCEHALTRVLCMPFCVCSHFCHFTVTTCQPPPLSAVHQFPLSLSLSASLLSVPISLSLSLSPMNRLNFLMSCFYGLLMLIHSSPYALSLASVHLSVSLDSSIHPHPPTLFCPALLLQQYLYLQALKYTPVNTFTVTCAIPRCAHPVKRYTRGNLRAYFWIQLKLYLRWCD